MTGILGGPGSTAGPAYPATGLVIGVDIGGTKVLAGEVSDDGTVVSTALRRTPGRRVAVEQVEDALTEAVTEVADGRPIAGVGLAAAGFVDRAGERVMFAPHLPWRGEPTRSRLSERWGVPVALDNDANCAARAELAIGAAAGASEALMITLGTGIGGAVISSGRVLRGRNGMAGEFGHMQVMPDGRECECGRSGCWEQYSSGNALVRFVQSRIDHTDTVLEQMCDSDPSRLTGPMVTDAARQGDKLAGKAFRRIGRWLGVGTANLVAAFDPEIVVIGGGVSQADDLLLDPARRALADNLVGAANRQIPPIVRGRFASESGVVGAAALIRSALAGSTLAGSTPAGG